MGVRVRVCLGRSRVVWHNMAGLVVVSCAANAVGWHGDGVTALVAGGDKSAVTVHILSSACRGGVVPCGLPGVCAVAMRMQQCPTLGCCRPTHADAQI